MPQKFTTDLVDVEVAEHCSKDQILELAQLAERQHFGLSSAGMIRWAACGGGDVENYDGYRPIDEGDLARCEGAVAQAPQWLAAAATPLLECFRAEVAERTAEVAARRAEVDAELEAVAVAHSAQMAEAETQGLHATVELGAKDYQVLQVLINEHYDSFMDRFFDTVADGVPCELGITRAEAEEAFAKIQHTRLAAV